MRKWGFWVFCFLAAFWVVLAHATPGRCAGITVVTEPWPPYTYSDEDGTVRGVVTEIVQATLERSGLEYTIEVYPWARAYDTAKSRENVLIYSIFRLPSREKLFKWIHIDGFHVNMFLFRPKYRDDIVAKTLEEARQYRIGVTRETSTHHFLLSKGFVEGTNLFPVNSEEQNALKSSPKTRRIDFTTGDELSLAHWLKEAKLPSDYWVPQVPLFHKEVYMAFGARTSDEVVEKVSAAYKAIRDEGTLDAIVEKYYRMYE